MIITINQAREAKRILKDDLKRKRLSDIVGVGITRTSDGGFALAVDLEYPVSNNQIPEKIEGVSVHTKVVGKVYPFGALG
ncbi:MAG: hypothetical protein F6K10_07740 [Moorea sp. SIO2B7]|nr:hypothetical protein [Moorena sp. SIO2B7]